MKTTIVLPVAVAAPNSAPAPASSSEASGSPFMKVLAETSKRSGSNSGKMGTGGADEQGASQEADTKTPASDHPSGMAGELAALALQAASVAPNPAPAEPALARRQIPAHAPIPIPRAPGPSSKSPPSPPAVAPTPVPREGGLEAGSPLAISSAPVPGDKSGSGAGSRATTTPLATAEKVRTTSADAQRLPQSVRIADVRTFLSIATAAPALGSTSAKVGPPTNLGGEAQESPVRSLASSHRFETKPGTAPQAAADVANEESQVQKIQIAASAQFGSRDGAAGPNGMGTSAPPHAAAMFDNEVRGSPSEPDRPDSPTAEPKSERKGFQPTPAAPKENSEPRLATTLAAQRLPSAAPKQTRVSDASAGSSSMATGGGSGHEKPGMPPLDPTVGWSGPPVGLRQTHGVDDLPSVLRGAVADLKAAITPALQAQPAADASGVVRQIDISLQPGELGDVAVRLRSAGGALSVVIEVQKPEAAREIENRRNEIMAALGAAGQNVSSILIRESSPPTAPAMNGADAAGGQNLSASTSGQGFSSGTGGHDQQLAQGGANRPSGLQRTLGHADPSRRVGIFV